MEPLVRKAHAFAAKAHAGVFRMFSGEPYVEHPMRVAAMLAELGFDPDVVAAGVLHDVIEDCPVSEAELAAEFSPRIAALVVEVTNPEKIPGMSKAARLAGIVQHLAASSYAGASIKLADMLDNSSNVSSVAPEFAKGYLPKMAAKLAVLGHGHPELLARVKKNLENIA
ncbi:HD domain-containing protein [Bradyrhizobium sp. SRL28]|uniref:HD domain-containing protein n=1 Tax=Bradyrhizobium sp. SRL28 TaxID=2836178 RepID=UPI001BDF25E6|nr:HD domain-containing protein [Bradyrhizobium sp. SRL28]MBT1509431.1 HD domain-containing protein [Bradyrhizobium sp. SRL28]